MATCNHCIRWIFTFLCIFICIPEDSAQLHDIRFTHITPATGLISTHINHLYRDRIGYLWIGTDNGLIRFDGLNFKTYQHKDDDSTTLTHSSIYKIVEDHHSDLWITTGIGLSRYNRRNDNFSRFYFDTEKRTDKEEKGFYTELFYKDKDGLLWLYVNGKVILFDLKTNKGKIISKYSNGYNYTPQTNGEKLRVFVAKEREGAFVHYLHNDRLTSVKEIFTGKNNMPVLTLQQFYWQNDSTLWTCGAAGLMRVNLRDYSFRIFSEYNHSKVNVNDMDYYRDGLLFVTTSNMGLLLFDINTMRFVDDYVNSLADNHSLISNNVSTAFSDSDYVFVASRNSGISIGRLHRGPFQYLFRKSDLVNDSRLNAVVSAISLDSSNLLIATQDIRLYLWDIDSNKAISDWDLRRVNQAGMAPVNMFALSDGRILLNFYQSISVYDPKYNKVSNLSIKSREPLYIYRFRELGSGTIIACTSSGFFKIKAEENHLIAEEWTSVNNQLNWKDFYDLFEIDAHHFAVHTRSSDLMIYEHDNYHHCRYIRYIRTPYTIYQHASCDSGVFFATVQGLKVMNPLNFQFRDALSDPANSINNLLCRNGKLYMTTETEIWVYDTRSGKVTSFSNGDGLLNSRFASNTLIQIKSNQMIVGGMDGLSAFDPSRLVQEQKQFRISVNQISINDLPLHDTNSNYIRQLHLPYNKNNLEIEVSGIGFNDPSNNHFYYVMTGIDDVPVMVAGSSMISYKQLKSGTYTFSVMTLPYGKALYSLQIIIAPPFWSTWWFIVIVAVTALSFTYYLFRRRVKAFERRSKEKMQLIIHSQEEERKRIARDLHDDFGARLSTLKLYIQTSEKRTADSPAILKASRLMIDETIGQLRNILMNLSPKSLDENGMAAALSEVEHYINRTGLIKCHVDTAGFNGQLKSEVAFALYRVNMELINNTIKYAGATDIFISLVTREKEIAYLYEDNGKGCDLGKINAGYGLENIRTNVQAFSGQVGFESSPGRGFVANIEYPLNVLM